jgi:hypothetical protein
MINQGRYGISHRLLRHVLSSSNLILVGLLAILAGCAANNAARSLVRVEPIAQELRLTFPLSAVALTFPKGGLVRAYPDYGGGTRHPAYFNFVDVKTMVTLSGWFITEMSYPGIETVKKDIEGGPRLSWVPAPESVSVQKQGNWDVIFYSLAGFPHMRACRVVRGTWVDLHLSIASGTSNGHGTLTTFLADIHVETVAQQSGGGQRHTDETEKNNPTKPAPPAIDNDAGKFFDRG